MYTGLITALIWVFYGSSRLFRQVWMSSASRSAPKVADFRRRRVKKLKISTPVFVLSLPKSGTTSLARYFICGGVPSAHTYRFQNGSWLRLGDCLRDNFQKNISLLQGCGPYKVWSDLGVVTGNCFYPSLEALDRIARDYPHATLIISYRAHWFESVQKWMGGSLVRRWINRCPVFPNTTDSNVWLEFYRHHRRQIRSLVERNPTLNLLEIDLEERNIGQKLQDVTGISTECWGHCRPETGECLYS